jgi:hypothetical protein
MSERCRTDTLPIFYLWFASRGFDSATPGEMTCCLQGHAIEIETSSCLLCLHACCCVTASSTSLQAMDVLVKTSGDAFHGENTKRAVRNLLNSASLFITRLMNAGPKDGSPVPTILCRVPQSTYHVRSPLLSRCVHHHTQRSLAPTQAHPRRKPWLLIRR